MRISSGFVLILALAGLTCLQPGIAYAQVSGVEVAIEQDHVGLGGYIRPGAWTPLRLSILNRSAQARELQCSWVLSDKDGDVVVSQRTVTVNPYSPDYPPPHVWLYACLPRNTSASTRWIVQLVDTQNGEAVATVQVAPNDKIVAPHKTAIGICGMRDLGLKPFTRQHTQHEPITLVGGLSLVDLPDRWQGLAMLDTLIWTAPDGGDPSDPAMRVETENALREYVRNGGHLVIVMPTNYDGWSGGNLRDLLPATKSQMRPLEGPPPAIFGSPKSPELANLQMTAFNVGPKDGVAVLARAGLSRLSDPAVVVAKRYGFGRVTLMGADIAHSSMANQGLPNGRRNIWHEVFHWQGPIFSDDFVEAEVNKGNMSRVEHRPVVRIGNIIPSRIGMTGTAAGAILAAIILFGLYWLLAGPVMFAVLKKQGRTRHAWLLFTLAIAVFTVVAWGGAWAMRPTGRSLAHFSVLDIDLRTGNAKTRSWLSVFLPAFGRAELAVDPASKDNYSLIASPGTEAGGGGDFLDPQPYAVDAIRPAVIDAPSRATTKRLEVAYSGRVDQPREGLTQVWPTPTGQMRMESGWAVGSLTHQFPAALENVLIVLCPGRNATRRSADEPMVWRLDKPWKPGTPLKLDGPPPAKAGAQRLVVPLKMYAADRQWKKEGHLGNLLGAKPGATQQGIGTQPVVQMKASEYEIAQAIEIMTFFDALPPPNYRKVDYGGEGRMYQRNIGRELNMTPLVDGRCLIILGHLPGSDLPLPLTVDGRTVSKVDPKSWTVVRMVYDLND